MCSDTVLDSYGCLYLLFCWVVFLRKFEFCGAEKNWWFGGPMVKVWWSEVFRFEKILIFVVRLGSGGTDEEALTVEGVVHSENFCYLS